MDSTALADEPPGTHLREFRPCIPTAVRASQKQVTRTPPCPRWPCQRLAQLDFFGPCLSKAASTSSFLIRAAGLPRSSRSCS
jgi:hypothetical protein